jgi:hypothetical protein
VSLAATMLTGSLLTENSMRIAPNFVLSLVLTTIICFTVPIIVLGAILGICSIASYLPGLMGFGKQGAIIILEFLAIFGNGKPFNGVMVLGLTISIAGVLLDLLNFYRYHSLRD